MIIRRRFLTAAAGALVAPLIVRPGRAANLRVRRDVMDLPDGDAFFGKYAAAVRAMHALPASDGRNWRRQAQIHADFCKHMRPSFLHWHRHYLAFFERICGEVIGDPSFALPYWNWTKKSGRIPAPFYDLAELNVESWNDPGQYDGNTWSGIDTVPARGLAKGRGLQDDPERGGAFTTATIDGIKRMRTSSTFFRALEGQPHNNGHVVTGATATGKAGHMASGLSPLDPIFWLHHCMVDRLWAEWQRSGNVTPDPAESYQEDFVDERGRPAPVVSAAASDPETLGYTYDVLQTAADPTSSSAPDATVLGALLPVLEKALSTADPVVIGAAKSSELSSPFLATAVRVPVSGLPAALAAERPFRQLAAGFPRLGLETGRLLLRVSAIDADAAAGDLLVNVFVDCPYLTPQTPYSDPHYAGTFSFFGAGGHVGHGREALIDISSAVRNLVSGARLKEDEILVQMMPLPANRETKSAGSFSAGLLEILRA